jgi:hypothetical protein
MGRNLAFTGEVRNAYTFLRGVLNERENFRELGREWKVIKRRIIRK